MYLRRPLMFLLSLGVIFGYGGAIASARWHARHHDCGDRWGSHGRIDDRFQHPDLRFDTEPQRTQAAPAPAPVPQQPQTVVVQPAAAPAAAAPQIFFIMPGATAPQAVTPVAVPAVAASPAPAAQ